MTSFKSIASCQAWLDAYIDQATPKSNERFLRMLAEIDFRKNHTQIILVGGTNGKGSTCVFLESILEAAGARTGTYLSPHLLHITERVRVHGVPVTEDIFCKAFETARCLYADEPIHWFEFMTVVAFIIFQPLQLDYLLIEVGLGGLQDITNNLDPDISVITSIGLDHQDILGETVAEIGLQKAGIFRPYKVAICGERNPPSSVLTYAKQVGCDLKVSPKDFSYAVESQTWSWYSHSLSFLHLPLPQLPLMNASTALAVIANLSLPIPHEAVVRGLQKASLPGRWQMIASNPSVIVDVAHNAHGFTYLAKQIKTLSGNGKIYAVCAMQDKKNIEASLPILCASFTHWYLANLAEDSQFVIRAKAILDNAGQAYTISDNLISAVKKATANAAENDRIIIFGSFYTVMQVLGNDIYEK
jgi:dihydrofolate synthase/folylpolyglutamate synthase